MKNYKSTMNLIKYGVPQGYILAFLLFITYINDFSSVSSVTFPLLFADNTSLFTSNKDITPS